MNLYITEAQRLQDRDGKLLVCMGLTEPRGAPPATLSSTSYGPHHLIRENSDIHNDQLSFLFSSLHYSKHRCSPSKYLWSQCWKLAGHLSWATSRCQCDLSRGNNFTAPASSSEMSGVTIYICFIIDEEKTPETT